MVSLSVLLEIAKKLDCDMGYLLCEYDEKRRIVADVKEATGLESDVIDIILNMKDSFLKLSILNDLLKDDYFLSIINLLYMVDYHYEKGMELDRIEEKVACNYKNAETLEEKEKFEKRYKDIRRCRTLTLPIQNPTGNRLTPNFLKCPITSSSLYCYKETTASKLK